MTNKKTLNDSLHELDHKLGALLCNVESLKAIDAELGHVREDVDNTDKSDVTSLALTMRGIDNKIVMIDDLLRYTLKDIIKNHEDCEHIKTGLFLEYVKGDENE